MQENHFQEFEHLGYKRGIIKKQMVVKADNRKKRVEWCRTRRNWTVEENWEKNWIFSDESQVVIGTDKRVYVWRKDEEVNNPHLVSPAPGHRENNFKYTNP